MSRNNDANRLDWQVRAGNVTQTSEFGTVALPTPTIRGRNAQAFVVPAGQFLLVTEVHAIVIPWTISAGQASRSRCAVRVASGVPGGWKG